MGIFINYLNNIQRMDFLKILIAPPLPSHPTNKQYHIYIEHHGS